MEREAKESDNKESLTERERFIEAIADHPMVALS